MRNHSGTSGTFTSVYLECADVRLLASRPVCSDTEAKADIYTNCIWYCIKASVVFTSLNGIYCSTTVSTNACRSHTRYILRRDLNYKSCGEQLTWHAKAHEHLENWGATSQEWSEPKLLCVCKECEKHEGDIDVGDESFYLRKYQCSVKVTPIVREPSQNSVYWMVTCANCWEISQILTGKLFYCTYLNASLY